MVVYIYFIYDALIPECLCIIGQVVGKCIAPASRRGCAFGHKLLRAQRRPTAVAYQAVNVAGFMDYFWRNQTQTAYTNTRKQTVLVLSRFKYCKYGYIK